METATLTVTEPSACATLDVRFEQAILPEGLAVSGTCRSQYLYGRLGRFRAGIESGVSWLKRSLGLTCCTWKGWNSFKSYLW